MLSAARTPAGSSAKVIASVSSSAVHLPNSPDHKRIHLAFPVLRSLIFVLYPNPSPQIKAASKQFSLDKPFSR